MPGYDGTGPQGSGPNGRGLGPCSQAGSSRRGFWGFRRGGAGRGWGFRWFSRFPANEKEDLENEKQWLSEQMEAINKRLDDLS